MSYPNLTRTSSKGRPGTNIVRQLSDKVRQSNGRRLEHYSAQRAQDARDALPLIHSDERRSSRPASYFPTSPRPSYQPHQLIAVCFNHMAGKDCDHCRNLEHSMSDHHSDTSRYSHHTLGYQSHGNGAPLRHSNPSLNSHSFNDEKLKDDGEKGQQPGPPLVVDFWDSRLSSLRLQLLGLWGKTSKPTPLHAFNRPRADSFSQL